MRSESEIAVLVTTIREAISPVFDSEALACLNKLVEHIDEVEASQRAWRDIAKRTELVVGIWKTRALEVEAE